MRMRKQIQAPTNGLAEIGVVVGALLSYMILRVVVEGSPATATHNARRILDIERALHLDVERGAQAAVLDHPNWMSFWNIVYKWLYWPSVALAMVVLWFVARHHYRLLRNALIIAAGLGIVIFGLFPVSPPRFLAGYTDTLVLDGMRSSERDTIWKNAYAAVPSFHVGWPALAGWVVSRAFGRWWVSLLALVPAALIGASVVVTGNHFVLDAVAGLLVVAFAYRLAASPATEALLDSGQRGSVDPDSSPAEILALQGVD